MRKAPYERIDVTTFPHPEGLSWVVGCDLPDHLYRGGTRPEGPALPPLAEWDTEEKARTAALLQARLFLHHGIASSVTVIHDGNEILTLTE